MFNFIAKKDSIFMKILNVLTYPFMFGKFNSVMWTVIGNTIYYPTCVEDPKSAEYAVVIEHEMVHQNQKERYGSVLFYLLYFILPLPILYSGRWFLEREAYLCEINSCKNREEKLVVIDNIVEALWKSYFFPYYRKGMKKYFLKFLNA